MRVRVSVSLGRMLDAAGTSLAMRIAAILVLTPSYNNAVAGATALNVAGGMSGFALGLAPELALAGFTAQPDAIEEALGQLVGDGFAPERLLVELGARWEITRNCLRLRACCLPIYAALDALEDAIAALGAKPHEVERIDVATYRFASVMRNPEPPNYFASKYSLPHVAACLIVRGGAGFAEVDDSALADPAIAALRRRVHIAADPEMTAAAPALRRARVTLTLTDGRRATRACDSPRGDCLNPYDPADIREKFRLLAGAALTPDGLDAVAHALDTMEAWPSAAILTDLLRRHARPEWR
jgi:2-methylcitrate dehydratase PrpD